MGTPTGKVVSLHGIHDESLKLAKAPEDKAEMGTQPGEGEQPAPVKVRRLDGTICEIDPSAGSSWTMPRLAHPEKLVSNKAEALRRFVARQRKAGKVDPKLQDMAAAAAQEEEERKRAAAQAAAPRRNAGKGRVVVLTGAEPTRTAQAPAQALPQRVIQVHSEGAGATRHARVGSKRKAGVGGGPAAPRPVQRTTSDVFSRLSRPPTFGAVADVRVLIAGKRPGQ